MIKKIAIGPIFGETGGVPQHVLNIVRYSQHNHKVIKYSPLSLYYPRYKGIGYFLLRHPNIPVKDPYGLFLAKKILPKYDVVHTHGHPLWYEIYQRSKNSKAKYIHTVHQIYFEEDSRSKKEWKMRNNQNIRLFEYCKEADLVISTAKHLQKFLLDKHGIESIFIPNGVDLEKIKQASPKFFIEKFGIKEDFFLFIGNILSVKRPELFIRLAEMIPEKLFVMIGWGLSKESLLKVIEDIPNNVIILDYLSHEDVIAALCACRAYILPSSRETFGITLLEAMACKKPVVATNNMGPAEIISDKVDGFLFELDDTEDLYEKALLAWENPKIGEKGYKKVNDNFDWKVVIKKIDQVYESLAG